MNTDVQQARKNYRKTLRAAIRLKHSIAADNEINEVEARYLQAFDKAVMQGKLPPAIDPRKAFGA